jgi:hypothetical protein
MGGSELVGDFKLVQRIKGIDFVADFCDIGSGYGGYSQDHEYFGRHQTLQRAQAGVVPPDVRRSALTFGLVVVTLERR